MVLYCPDKIPVWYSGYTHLFYYIPALYVPVRMDLVRLRSVHMDPVRLRSAHMDPVRLRSAHIDSVRLRSAYMDSVRHYPVH